MDQPGWQHRTFRWRDDDGPSFEAWVTELRDAGWQTWAPGPGTWAQLEGRRTFILALRRPSERPFRTERIPVSERR